MRRQRHHRNANGQPNGLLVEMPLYVRFSEPQKSTALEPFAHHYRTRRRAVVLPR
jgi:hypothetical protein